MWLGDVVDEGAAGPAELVVEHHTGGPAAEAGQDAFAQARRGARAVAFDSQDASASREDRFDSSADRGQVRGASLRAFAAGAHDREVAPVGAPPFAVFRAKLRAFGTQVVAHLKKSDPRHFYVPEAAARDYDDVVPRC